MSTPPRLPNVPVNQTWSPGDDFWCAVCVCALEGKALKIRLDTVTVAFNENTAAICIAQPGELLSESGEAIPAVLVRFSLASYRSRVLLRSPLCTMC